MITRVLILVLLFSAQLCLSQNKSSKAPIKLVQVKTDSLFDSKQNINLLYVYKSKLNTVGFEFSHSGRRFKRTSDFALENDALAAINGGFFNMDEGGSATYFELEGSVISRTRDPELKWGISDSIINGAIVINNHFALTIENAQPEIHYMKSDSERSVLVAGPLLLLDKVKMQFPDRRFVTDRHPRSCLCVTETAVVLITIDGRSNEAAGMNLFEVQEFLSSLACVDAINLDGGGSTTLWMKKDGVVNKPSDPRGERQVSNVLMVVKRQN